MRDQVFTILQAIGRSFMLPVAILPIAGLLLGIGASFTNATTIQTYGLENILGNGTILHSLLTIMSGCRQHHLRQLTDHLCRRRRHRHGKTRKRSRRLVGHDCVFSHARIDEFRLEVDW